MGLPVANAIVGAHGGTIGVVSQLGQGSVFSISLPIYSNLRFPPNSFRHGEPADRKDDIATHEKDSRR
jgi:hypothetical protein